MKNYIAHIRYIADTALYLGGYNPITEDICRDILEKTAGGAYDDTAWVDALDYDISIMLDVLDGKKYFKDIALLVNISFYVEDWKADIAFVNRALNIELTN